MLRRFDSCSRPAIPSTNSSSLRSIFSNLDSTSSSFLAFSKTTEKNDGDGELRSKKNVKPKFFPYHKDHFSSKKFHWKEPARKMLQELKENKMEPTHRVSNWWSLHDPIEPLQKQHAIEYKYLREIVDDPANHSFQKSAFEETKQFLLSATTTSPTEAGGNEEEKKKDQGKEKEEGKEKCKEFFDVLRFRLRHGVALPAEIAIGRVIGAITDSDVDDKEALALAQELSPRLWCNPIVGGGSLWYVTSALVHASGIGWNTAKLPSDWEEVGDHLPLGYDSVYDKTREKLLVKAHEATKPASTPASCAYYYPNRLKKIQDWSKAHIVFVDLPALDRTLMDYRGFFASYVNPIDDRLKVDALFGLPVPGLNRAPQQGTSFVSADSDRVALNRWHHMLCVPKISTFSLAVSSNFSDFALEMFSKKMEQDPNLIVVFQHVGSSGLWPGGVGSNGGGAFTGSLSSNFAGPPDMHLIEQVFLRSLPIHGYTTTPGWQGAFAWIEDVLKTELGFPLETIPVSAACSAQTKDFWLIEPGSNRLSQQDDGNFRIEEQLLPKCAFDCRYPNYGDLSDFQSADCLGLPLLTYDKVVLQNDCSPVTDICRSVKGYSNFWKGIPMPTTRQRLRSEFEGDSAVAAKKGRRMKWWVGDSAAYPFHVDLEK